MRALIMEDGLSRQALAAGRALRAAGWTVGVAAETPHGLAACSRATAHAHQAPAPQLDPDGFIAAANQAVEEVGYELVFGARDADILTLSARRDEIAAIVPHGRHSDLVRVLDKAELAAAAVAAGVPTPRIVAATAQALEEARLPVMVKARLHACADGTRLLPRIDSKVARTREELQNYVATMRVAGGAPMLQEYLAGKLVAFVVLADDEHRIVGQLQQEADAISPPGAGVSVRAHTVAPDPALARRVAALVSELALSGLAEMQFIVPPDGEPRLIDVNPRFYGSLALAVAAGVNFPAAWAAMATGRAASLPSEARVGVRYQWLYGDLRSSVDVRPPELMGRLAASARFTPGAVQSVFEWSDPLPALREIGLVSGRALRKAQPWTHST
jgi:predicted ATP-grasp superfamily ATP-dependent carboligase